MISLPIDAHLPEITDRLAKSRSLVLVAPPGAGKTTRVPPAVLRAGLLSSAEHPNLVMLQPRRVAARASAQRIAEENHWQLGREVGYHVRFDRKIGPATRLRVLTEGILTRQLLDDPFLEGVGCVILDEFHERSIHTDLCIALLREVQQTVREDLLLIVMSATLEAEGVSQFLGDCPIVRTEGRTFPVDIRHAGWSQDRIAERAADAVIEVLNSASRPSSALTTEHSALPPGDILVFLPGVEEIRRTLSQLDRVAREQDLLLLPLHGSLPPDDQMLALHPAKQQKVICATNIAETSLTIDGVRTVIDSGLARVAGYDPQRGLDRLDLARISKASATQRAGRAGRTAPGQCIRLWSKSEEQAMADFQTPEICRVDLCGTVLLLHAWGKSDPRAFGWYEPPPQRMLESAERLLAMLGAITSDKNGQITPLGRRMLALSVHPRLARLLVEARDHRIFEDGATIAALLSEKDIVWEERGVPRWQRQATTVGKSDLLVRVELLRQAEQARFAPHLRDQGIDPVAARQVAKVRDDLARLCDRLTNGQGDRGTRAQGETGAAPSRRRTSPSPLPVSPPPLVPLSSDLHLRLPLLAYPDRVCRRRASDPLAAAMVGGGGVRLAPESIVGPAVSYEFFVALDARQDERSNTREAVVRIASAIDPAWLAEFFPGEVRTERVVVYDPEREAVTGSLRTWYRDLLLREEKNVSVSPPAAAAALAAAVLPRAREIITSDDAAAQLLARVDLLRRHMPEHPWPTFDDAALGEVLTEASAGKRSLEDLRRAPFASLLMARLPYPLDRLLDQHAPDAVAVPTGNRIRLKYAAGQAPVLAVRLQEVFGWTDTPTIAGGRVPVLLHLLGPNYRPVQITSDLRSFWTTTYFQVRKDLRVRYPKHSWPQDPLSAKPEAKGRRRDR